MEGGRGHKIPCMSRCTTQKASTHHLPTLLVWVSSIIRQYGQVPLHLMPNFPAYIPVAYSVDCSEERTEGEAGNWTQSLVHARQGLYQPILILLWGRVLLCRPSWPWTLMPQPPEYWNYKCTPPYPIKKMLLNEKVKSEQTFQERAFFLTGVLFLKATWVKCCLFQCCKSHINGAIK
jgi:hypothetical protein